MKLTNDFIGSYVTPKTYVAIPQRTSRNTSDLRLAIVVNVASDGSALVVTQEGSIVLVYPEEMAVVDAESLDYRVARDLRARCEMVE